MNILLVLLYLLQSAVLVAVLYFYYKAEKQWMKYSLSKSVQEFEQPKKEEEKPEEPQDELLEEVSEDEFSKIISRQLAQEE